jgi:siroheme synthase-like protein
MSINWIKRQVFHLAVGFPLYIDLKDNNCTVFGGGKEALDAVVTLQKFHAKITVVNPTLCPELEKMDQKGQIRYLRRKYFRGDCSSARLCVAATDDPAINVNISDECKNKNIPVAITKPEGFGTFTFPQSVISDNIVVTISGSASKSKQKYIAKRLETILPELLEEYKNKK